MGCLFISNQFLKAIKAAVLNRPYQLGFRGKTSFLFVKDVADIFLACSQAQWQGAAAFNMRGHVADVQEFLQALHEELPASKQLITIAADAGPLPLAYDFNETGLRALLGNKLHYRPLTDGIRITAQAFQQLLAEGRLHDKDL